MVVFKSPHGIEVSILVQIFNAFQLVYVQSWCVLFVQLVSGVHKQCVLFVTWALTSWSLASWILASWILAS